MASFCGADPTGFGPFSGNDLAPCFQAATVVVVPSACVVGLAFWRQCMTASGDKFSSRESRALANPLALTLYTLMALPLADAVRQAMTASLYPYELVQGLLLFGAWMSTTGLLRQSSQKGEVVGASVKVASVTLALVQIKLLVSSILLLLQASTLQTEVGLCMAATQCLLAVCAAVPIVLGESHAYANPYEPLVADEETAYDGAAQAYDWDGWLAKLKTDPKVGGFAVAPPSSAGSSFSDSRVSWSNASTTDDAAESSLSTSSARDLFGSLDSQDDAPLSPAAAASMYPRASAPMLGPAGAPCAPVVPVVRKKIIRKARTPQQEEVPIHNDKGHTLSLPDDCLDKAIEASTGKATNLIESLDSEIYQSAERKEALKKQLESTEISNKERRALQRQLTEVRKNIQRLSTRKIEAYARYSSTRGGTVAAF